MNINIRFGRPALAIVLAGALAGCGGAADLDAAGHAALHGEVQQLRAAAARDDRAAALRELAEFRAAVRGLLERGEIAPADAAALLAQADEVQAALPAPAPAAPVQARPAESRVDTVQAHLVRARPRPQGVTKGDADHVRKTATKAERGSKGQWKRARKHDDEGARWWPAVQRAWAEHEGGDDD